MSRSNQLAGLITATPTATLDTINEINTSLNNDANLSTTLTNSINAKASKSGDTFTGNVTLTSTSGAGVTVIDSDDKANGYTLRANGTRFQITENGVADVFAITAGGNVGIGTTSPVANLHIQTETDETDEGTDVALTLGSNTTGKMRMYFGVNDANNYTYIGSVESGTAYRNLILQPNGGNVGVGTSSPSVKFHVYDSADHARLSVQCANSSGRHWQFQSRNDGLFWIRDDTAGANRMIFDSTGNVGIGTNSPGEKVEISDGGTVGLRIRNNNNNGYSQIVFGTGSSASSFCMIRHERVGADQGKLHITKPNDGSGGNVFTIDHNGKIGIGDPISTTNALITGKSSGSDNAEIYLGATGTGNAGVVFDGSNGDFAGSDYYMLRQLNDLNVENWLGGSSDYIWKTASGTERMRIHSTGEVTMSHQPAFRAFTSPDFTSNGLMTGTNWSTSTANGYGFDNNNDFSQGTFTAPVDGVYLSTVMWDANGVTSTIYLMKNGTVSIVAYEPTGLSSGGWETHSYASTVKLSANDTLVLKAGSASGTHPFHMPGTWGHFSVTLLC